MSYRAQLGDRVQIEYVSRLSDDTSTSIPEKHRVLEFEVGSEEVIRGISNGVVGMAEGDRKRLRLAPQEAYGTIRRDLIHEIPRDRIPSTVNLEVGKWLINRRKDLIHSRRVRIIDIQATTVIVDGNHPLAGKTVTVEMQILSVETTAAG
jgi:FKBP-type peptidyl-prolyl cis-trans isomerase 2